MYDGYERSAAPVQLQRRPLKSTFSGVWGPKARLARRNPKRVVDQKIETEVFRNIERLKELRVEHQDLDQVISRLVNDPHVDQIMLRRLKKRKLMLKDMITQLESALESLR